jgi:hypothetical protein
VRKACNTRCRHKVAGPKSNCCKFPERWTQYGSNLPLGNFSRSCRRSGACRSSKGVPGNGCPALQERESSLIAVHSGWIRCVGISEDAVGDYIQAAAPSSSAPSVADRTVASVITRLREGALCVSRRSAAGCRKLGHERTWQAAGPNRREWTPSVHQRSREWQKSSRLKSQLLYQLSYAP